MKPVLMIATGILLAGAAILLEPILFEQPREQQPWAVELLNEDARRKIDRYFQ